MSKTIAYDAKWLVDADEDTERSDAVWASALSEKRLILVGEPPPGDNAAANIRHQQEALQAYHLQIAWKDLWENCVSTLIRELSITNPPDNATAAGLQTSDSPGVDLWKLGKSPYQYEPYPYVLVRAMRRIFSRFNLEAFLEDRTFPDYRNHLNQEWDALLVESKDFFVRAEAAIIALGKLRLSISERSSLNKIATSVIEQLDDMVDAIERTKAQIAVVESLRDKGFTARIFEMLRELHGEIQSQWGTWARRIKTPSLWFLITFLLAVIAYAVLAASVPTQLWLILCVPLPLLSFGWQYYLGRSKQDASIRKKIARLAIFHPEPAAKLTSRKLVNSIYQPISGEEGIAARRYTLWYPNALKSGRESLEQFRLRMVDLCNRSYARTMGITPKPYDEEAAFQPIDIKVSSKTWGWSLLLLSIVVVATLGFRICMSSAQWPPSFAVESKVSDGTCVIATGQILWPGPWEVVTYNKGIGVTVVPRDQVVRVAPMVENAIEAMCAAFNSGAGSGVAAGSDTASQRTGSGVSCANKAGAAVIAPASQTMIHLSGSHGAFKGYLTIPFPQNENEKIPCTGDLTKHPGAKVSSAMQEVLAKVSKAISSCRAPDGRLPKIDVRGFASSLDFDQSCGIDSTMRNLQLAEARRASVLSAMSSDAGKFDHSEAEGIWKAPFAVLSPNKSKRWGNWQHMRDAQVIRDQVDEESDPAREVMTRHVEIWLLDGAGCDPYRRLAGLR